MEKWTLCFLLLLSLTVCYDSEVILVKTISSEPEVTALCTNSTLEPVTLVVCKIRTERNRGEECRLLYVHGRGFDQRCDSRFTLVEKNLTMFLHLRNLTSVDSGNYTCECSFPGGTDILHLSITVDGKHISDGKDKGHKDSVPMLLQSLIGVTIVLIITGVIFVLIYRRTGRRRQPEAHSSHPNVEPQDIEPYSTFIRKESGLYSTVRINVSDTNTNNSNMFTREDTHAGNFMYLY